MAYKTQKNIRNIRNFEYAKCRKHPTRLTDEKRISNKEELRRRDSRVHLHKEVSGLHILPISPCAGSSHPLLGPITSLVQPRWISLAAYNSQPKVVSLHSGQIAEHLLALWFFVARSGCRDIHCQKPAKLKALHFSGMHGGWTGTSTTSSRQYGSVTFVYTLFFLNSFMQLWIFMELQDFMQRWVFKQCWHFQIHRSTKTFKF